MSTCVRVFREWLFEGEILTEGCFTRCHRRARDLFAQLEAREGAYDPLEFRCFAVYVLNIADPVDCR